MNPRGEMGVSVKGRDSDFYTKLHSFGLAGAITSIQLSVVPEFAVKKCIYSNLSWDVISETEKYENLILAFHPAYLSLYTDWKQETMTSVFIETKETSWDEELLKKPFD